MKKRQFEDISEWLNWLEVEGAVLATSGSDVRVVTRQRGTYFGSVQKVSSSTGTLVICTYGANSGVSMFTLEDAPVVEVLGSFRLMSDHTYRQMDEMIRIVIPIQSGCGHAPLSLSCTDLLSTQACPGWSERKCVSVCFDPQKHNVDLPLFYEAQH